MTSKPCTKCGDTKPLELFPRAKKARDGRDTRCKACAAAHVRSYAKENPERVKQSARRTSQKHAAKRRAYLKTWAEKNKAALRAHRKKWRDNNPEAARAAEVASRTRHRDALLERKRKYRAANKPKWAAYAQKRKASLLRAIPAWANMAAIAAIYEDRHRITLASGIEHHVDHIVPLRSPIVCGLHVENNLRVLEATENRRKFNNFADSECGDPTLAGSRAAPGAGGASQGTGGSL